MASEKSLEILRRFLDNPAPTLEEAVEAFTPLTIGDYDDVHIAALLATIRTRGETFADIAGATQAFLAAGRPFPVTGEGIMDTAGTGGDGANTINITTAASLTAAAGGVKMIKCGNRSVSSKSGSADVLEALNIPLDLDRTVRCASSSPPTSPSYSPRPTTRRLRTCSRCVSPSACPHCSTRWARCFRLLARSSRSWALPTRSRAR